MEGLSNLNNIPDEQLHQIMEYLDPVSLRQASLTDRKLYNMSLDRTFNLKRLQLACNGEVDELQSFIAPKNFIRSFEPFLYVTINNYKNSYSERISGSVGYHIYSIFKLPSRGPKIDIYQCIPEVNVASFTKRYDLPQYKHESIVMISHGHGENYYVINNADKTLKFILNIANNVINTKLSWYCDYFPKMVKKHVFDPKKRKTVVITSAEFEIYNVHE